MNPCCLTEIFLTKALKQSENKEDDISCIFCVNFPVWCRLPYMNLLCASHGDEKFLNIFAVAKLHYILARFYQIEVF